MHVPVSGQVLSPPGASGALRARPPDPLHGCHLGCLVRLRFGPGRLGSNLSARGLCALPGWRQRCGYRDPLHGHGQESAPDCARWGGSGGIFSRNQARRCWTRSWRLRLHALVLACSMLHGALLRLYPQWRFTRRAVYGGAQSPTKPRELVRPRSSENFASLRAPSKTEL